MRFYDLLACLQRLRRVRRDLGSSHQSYHETWWEIAPLSASTGFPLEVGRLLQGAFAAGAVGYKSLPNNLGPRRHLEGCPMAKFFEQMLNFQVRLS